MWLLGNKSIEQTVAEAQAKAAEDIRFFKVKIGVKPLDDEIATTLAVREALGPKIPVCADANCGLTLAAARRYVERDAQPRSSCSSSSRCPPTTSRD